MDGIYKNIEDYNPNKKCKIFTQKTISFLTNSFFSGQLSKGTAFMVKSKLIINALTLFLMKYKMCNIIMKTEQTTIVYAHWDRWTSYM